MERYTFKHERKELRLSRRDFIERARDGMTAILLSSAFGCRQSSSTSKSGPPDKETPGSEYTLMFFNSEEAATVEAVSARIIPSDSRPGAREAKVIYFIDHMLVTAYKNMQPIYRGSVSNLNEVSLARFGRPFASMSETEQDDILARMEQGTLPEWERAAEFFSIIRAHTIEGMFSDPRYNGNSARLGWVLIGADH